MSVLRAVTYCRVSTEDQAEHGTSLETQELACLRRAAEGAMQVVGQYRDEGVSGSLYGARPSIQMALDAIDTGAADALIVYSISRLSRDVEHQQQIRKRITRAGAMLVICDMPVSDTEEADLMYGVSGAFAQYEAKLIRKRTMSGSLRVAQKGKQPQRGQSPYGYHVVTAADVASGKQPVGTEGTYVVREDQAAVVRGIFSRYLTAGSINGIARWLDASGIPTPRGCGAWRAGTVQYILRNTVYRGAATYGLRHSLKDERRQTDEGLRHARYQRRREDGPLHEIPAPSIVDARDWDEANSKLRSAQSVFGGNPKRRFLLSTIGRCPDCGRGLAGRSSQGRRYYSCNRTGTDAHSTMHYEAGRLETLFVDALVAAVDAPGSLAAAAEAYRQECEVGQPDVDTGELRRRLTELGNREKMTAKAQIDALIAGRSPDVYDDLLRAIGKDRTILEAALARSEEAQSKRVAVAVNPTGATEALAALRRVLAPGGVLTIAEKRAAIAGLVREFEPVGRDGIRLYLFANARRPANSLHQRGDVERLVHAPSLPRSGT